MRYKSIAVWLLVLTVGLFSGVAGAQWETETVDSTGDVGQYPDIILWDGEVFISYYDATGPSLKFARRDDSSWTIETIDSVGDVGTHTSIAVDGYPAGHIVYRDETQDYVKYAFSDTTSWTVDIFDDGGGNGYFTNIAINTDTDDMYITYMNVYTQDLNVVVCQGGPCVYERPDDNQPCREGASMALGPDEQLHLSYQDADTSTLWYANRGTAAAWTTQQVDSEAQTGRINAIAADSLSNPHIGYYSFGDGDVRYAKKSEGAWTIQTVAGSDWVGYRTDLALDNADRPHLVYANLDDGTIDYAYLDAGVWTIEAIGNQAGEFCALAIGADDSVHVAYYREEGGADLIYAMLPGTGDDDDDTGEDDDTDDDDDTGDDDDDDVGDDDDNDDDAGDDDDDDDDGCGGCSLI